MPAPAPLVAVSHLVKQFARGGFLRRVPPVTAVDDVSFSIDEGETFGLVGESGSGKTTTGRCLLRLIEPTSGTVTFRGRDVLGLSGRDLSRARRDMQIVFQDPYSSLNPRMRARHIVEEPLVIHRLGDRESRRARVAELFGLVGLDPGHLERYPHQFSGGQRQRIGLARALALEPSFLVLDEPVSALDVSVQAAVTELLMDIQRENKTTMLFISHDLSVVRALTDVVVVMYRGRIVEEAPTATLFANPMHPYTRALLDAIPATNPRDRRQRTFLKAADIDAATPRVKRTDIAGAFAVADLPQLVSIAPGHRVEAIVQ
jgi:oligopeptide/dipeptide ABC transporter ATP-binding protein